MKRKVADPRRLKNRHEDDKQEQPTAHASIITDGAKHRMLFSDPPAKKLVGNEDKEEKTINEFASGACSRFPGHAYHFQAVSVKDDEDNRDENCCEGPDEYAISIPGPHSSLPDILPVRNGTANGQHEKQCENFVKRIKHSRLLLYSRLTTEAAWREHPSAL